MDEDNENKVPFTLALFAGGIAGTTVDVVMYPLDTLKTRLQVQSIRTHVSSRSTAHCPTSVLATGGGWFPEGWRLQRCLQWRHCDRARRSSRRRRILQRL